MVCLADELDTPFSQYPYRWDALAVSLLMTATLARIKEGPPCIMVALTYLERLVWVTTNHTHEPERHS